MNHSKIRDLGELSGPMAIFGGLYGNLEALNAFLDLADRLKIPSDHIIQTGDVVAYCADPLVCVEQIMTRNFHSIKGNVEESLAFNADDCGCGFEEGTACDVLSNQWYAYVDSNIGTEHREWMSELPDQLSFQYHGRRVRVLHGSSSEVNEFIFPSTSEARYESMFQETGADIIIAGHSGLPYTLNMGDRIWHNSGALGMPANDGTPRVWASLLVPDRQSVKIEHLALSYDYQSAHLKMVQAGLPNGYADALKSGLWPSLDVLPEKEKTATGTPIAFEGDGEPRSLQETPVGII
ncbi:MAG: metallophosphoesterase family protein [Methyloligellaceae bacterium]